MLRILINPLSAISTATILTTLLTIILASGNLCYSASVSQNKEVQPSAAVQTHLETKKNGDSTAVAITEEENASVKSLNLGAQIPGVGAFLGAMLDSLMFVTTDTENKFGKLFINFPLIFPDLYKVFITL